MQLAPGWTVIEPGESDTVGIDFAKELGTATISSVAWSCTLYNPVFAVDSNPSAVLVGGGFPIGTQAWQKVVGQVDGATYRLEAVITTNDGRTLKNWALLPCTSQ